MKAEARQRLPTDASVVRRLSSKAIQSYGADLA